MLTLVPFLDEFKGSQTAFVQAIATCVDPYKTWFIILPAVYVSVYTLWPKWLSPKKAKKALMQDLLTRINGELFSGNEMVHRVTLFKEVCWIRGVVRNYWYLGYHALLYPQKWKLYWRLPRRGRYLIVHLRCGRHYKKSSTMLRVEVNEISKCQGVAGAIRHLKAGVHKYNLPDISGVDLSGCSSQKDVKVNQRVSVRKYMEEGYITDFELLQKIHRRARQFYGTIIEKGGKVWGVIVVDSVAITSPFDESVRKRINSFALTIGSIIQMEV